MFSLSDEGFNLCHQSVTFVKVNFLRDFIGRIKLKFKANSLHHEDGPNKDGVYDFLFVCDVHTCVGVYIAYSPGLLAV